MESKDKLLSCIRKKEKYSCAKDMIRFLSREAKNFTYDEILGEAVIDGFMEQDDRYVVVLAGFIDMYSNTVSKYDMDRNELYRFINDNTYGSVMCDITDTDVRFSCYGEQIKYFDLSRTVDYMLGIAYSLLTGRIERKNIDFMYLIYNPTELDIDRGDKEEALAVYERLCEECNTLDLSTLFTVTVMYLRDIRGIGKITDEELEMLGYNFTVYLCDQELYPTLLV